MSYLINKRLSLISELKKINSMKGKPPNQVSIDQSLNDDLGGKFFKDILNDKQSMIFGDLSILNPEAFHYYLFDLLEYSLINQKLPLLFSMFIISLSKDSVSFDDRLNLLTEDEKKIVCKYFQYIFAYINSSKDIDAIVLNEDYSEEIKELVSFWCI